MSTSYCTVRAKKKNDADIRNVFLKYVCSAAVLQIGKLLPRIGRFLSKRIGLIHTLGSKTQFSFAYESSGAVFVASKVALVTGKQQWKWFPQMHIIRIDAYRR